MFVFVAALVKHNVALQAGLAYGRCDQISCDAFLILESRAAHRAGQMAFIRQYVPNTVKYKTLQFQGISLITARAQATNQAAAVPRPGAEVCL